MTKKTEQPDKASKVNEKTGEIYYPKFRVQFDFDYKGTNGSDGGGKKVTQPEMSLTVRQLLENHTRGINSPVKTLTPMYFDLEVPVIKDLTDVHEYRQHLEQRLAYTDEFIKKEKEEIKAKAKAEAEAEAKVTPPIPPTPKNTIEDGKDW
jgi:hypothetical protein